MKTGTFTNIFQGDSNDVLTRYYIYNIYEVNILE